MTSTGVIQQRTRRYLEEMDPDFRSAWFAQKQKPFEKDIFKTQSGEKMYNEIPYEMDPDFRSARI